MILEMLDVGRREYHSVGAVDHELNVLWIDFVHTRADQNSADVDREEDEIVSFDVRCGDGNRFWQFAMRENDDVRAVCVEKPIFRGFAVAWFDEARDPESVSRREVRIIGWADVEDRHAAGSIHGVEGVASARRR